MAKVSAIEKNKKRQKLAEKYGRLRAELRKKVVDTKLSDDERFEAGLKLQKLPRDTSPTRVINRCSITGRPRGILRKFMLSRIAFRDMAAHGKLPGVTKASW